MIPLSTTSIDVERKSQTRDPDTPADVDPYGEGYDEDRDATPDAGPEVWTVVASDIRANIGAGSGRLLVSLGNSQAVALELVADPCDLRNLDRVIDRSNGRVYAVEWAVDNPGVAGMLASVRAGLTEITGFGRDRPLE